MLDYHQIDPRLMRDNVFELVGEDWMLITAGELSHFNTMTASWGGLGILWGKKVAFCVIRPQRYTFAFMEKYDRFTLSFFEEDYREALNYCGTHSGRNEDKVRACGLTPVETSPGLVSFMESRLILECKKLYFHDLDPHHFLDPSLSEVYPARDYHRMYIGEVINCLSKVSP